LIPRHKRSSTIGVALRIGLLCVTSPALAASATDPTTQDDRSDRVSDQQDAIDGAIDAEQQRQGAAPRAFSVRIDAPLYYNSNAQQATSGGSAALEGDPEIELRWSHAMTSLPLKSSIRLRADTDRFANVPQADEDEMSATFKTQYFDANNDQAIAPFVSYKGTLIFDATFSPWTQTKNDLAVGVAKVFNFDGELHALPISGRSAADAVWSLAMNMAVQRRLRTPGADSTALIGALEVICTPFEEWAISLGVDARQRWFDAVMSKSGAPARRDFTIEPLFTLLWDPSAPLWGSPTIAMQVDFERKASNLPGKSYNQWAVGPVLTASWRF
jgi:hypothetical protein